jgi:hypothetical protein
MKLASQISLPGSNAQARTQLQDAQVLKTIRRRPLDASVLLIKAVGGDRNVNKLPNV